MMEGIRWEGVDGRAWWHSEGAADHTKRVAGRARPTDGLKHVEGLEERRARGVLCGRAESGAGGAGGGEQANRSCQEARGQPIRDQ